MLMGNERSVSVWMFFYGWFLHCILWRLFGLHNWMVFNKLNVQKNFASHSFFRLETKPQSYLCWQSYEASECSLAISQYDIRGGLSCSSLILIGSQAVSPHSSDGSGMRWLVRCSKANSALWANLRRRLSHLQWWWAITIQYSSEFMRTEVREKRCLLFAYNNWLTLRHSYLVG